MSEEIYFHRILRPYPSLSIQGQKWTLYLLLALLLILAPIVLMSGAWLLFVFLLSPVLMLYAAFMRRNYDLRLYEEITITRDTLDLRHVRPSGQVLSFKSDLHWVKIELQKEGGPVEDYLTLRDQKRHVELGRFLSPEERVGLYRDLLALKAKL